MKIINRICGGILVLALFVAVLITSVEIAAYGDWSFYEKEYRKNEVLTSVDMEMDDLMEVTREMLKYLRGNRADLVIVTTIGGEQKEFFNDREKFHMADCQVLFVAAIWIRRICLLLMAGALLIIFGRRSTAISEKTRFVMGFLWKGILVILGAAGCLVAVIAMNFDRAFVTFHHIFFDNDLWLLDPRTDRLINIVPQQFFIDICIRIGIILGIFLILIFSMAFIVERAIIKKLKDKK